MTKPKDPLSNAVDMAFGIASSAMSMAAQQVRSVAGNLKDEPQQTESNPGMSQAELERTIEIILEREGVARQDELAALRRSIVSLQAELGSTHEEIQKLRRKLKKVKGQEDES